jgi:hypothetical protein
MGFITNYFLKIFFRSTPTRPTRPEPRSKSEAGSGTKEPPGPPEVSPPICSTVSKVVTYVEVKLDLLKGAGSSEGQPTIPKNIITIHKTINKFFLLSFNF